MQQIIGESTPAEGLQAVLRSMQRLCNDIYMSLMVIELEMHNGSGDRRLWSRWQDGSEEELYRSGEKYPLLDPLSKPSSLEGGWPSHRAFITDAARRLSGAAMHHAGPARTRVARPVLINVLWTWAEVVAHSPL
jgi:hypothetical protein